MKNASDSLELVGEINALPNGDQKLGNLGAENDGSEMQNSGPRWRYRAKRTGSLDAKDLDFDMGCNMHDKLPALT